MHFPSGKWKIGNSSLKEKGGRVHVLHKQFYCSNHADFLSLQPKKCNRYNDKGQVKLKMCKSQAVNFLPISSNTQAHLQQEMTNGIISVCFIGIVLLTSYVHLQRRFCKQCHILITLPFWLLFIWNLLGKYQNHHFSYAVFMLPASQKVENRVCRCEPVHGVIPAQIPQCTSMYMISLFILQAQGLTEIIF